MLNDVKLIGFVSRPPKKIGDLYAFPLAVYRDQHRNQGSSREQESQRGEEEGQAEQGNPRDVPDFPPVIVLATSLPPYVTHRAKIRVEGFLRTRNRSEALHRRVLKDLRRGGVEETQARDIASHMPSEVLVKLTEVEVVAERVFKEA